MYDLYERQKETAGSLVTFIWLGVGVFLFLTNDEAVFLSWQAALYFLPGTFIAALTLGLTLYAVQRAVARVLTALLIKLTASAVLAITVFGLLSTMVWGVLIYHIADFVVSDLLFPSTVASTSEAVNGPKLFKCKQPVPEFSLGFNSNPSNHELEQLCNCIWSRFPEGGWEREISAKIRAREDPGWRAEAFGSRFGTAVEICGGMEL